MPCLISCTFLQFDVALCETGLHLRCPPFSDAGTKSRLCDIMVSNLKARHHTCWLLKVQVLLMGRMGIPWALPRHLQATDAAMCQSITFEHRPRPYPRRHYCEESVCKAKKPLFQASGCILAAPSFTACTVPGSKRRIFQDKGDLQASFTLPMLVHISKGPYVCREAPRNMGTLGTALCSACVTDHFSICT